MLFPGQRGSLFRCHLNAFDTSSAVRLHSSLSSTHDVITVSPLTITFTTAIIEPQQLMAV